MQTEDAEKKGRKIVNTVDEEKKKSEHKWWQSGTISKEEAGCGRDGHRLASEGTTTPPQDCDEDAEPRTLVDPIGGQRHLIDTVISLGVEQGVAVKKAIEVYSPTRGTKAARQRPGLNIEGLRALDLSTNHPGGCHRDFNIKAHRELARQICATEDPDWIIGSPPCTDFSILGRSNHRRMDPEVVLKRIKEGRRHPECFTKLYRDQLERGNHLLHEHPVGASSWKEECI